MIFRATIEQINKVAIKLSYELLSIINISSETCRLITTNAIKASTNASDLINTDLKIGLMLDACAAGILPKPQRTKLSMIIGGYLANTFGRSCREVKVVKTSLYVLMSITSVLFFCSMKCMKIL